MVEERPGERLDLRGDRHVAGHLLGLRGGQARLRRGRAAQLDPGVGLGRDGRPGAGQRELRLEGDPGVVVPVRGYATGGVRHGGDGHADRDGADLGCGHLRPQGADSRAAGAGSPCHRDPDGGRRRAAGLPLRHAEPLSQPEPGDGQHPRRPGVPRPCRGAAARSRGRGARGYRAARSGARPREPDTLPVYRVANAAAAYRGAVIDRRWTRWPRPWRST